MAQRSGRTALLRTGAVTAGVALFVGLLAWAVAWGPIDVKGLTPGQREAALRKQAQSLMPGGAEAWYREFYECETIAMHPDCTYAEYGFASVQGHDLADQVRRAATANGWTIEEQKTSPAGYDYFIFRRDGFTAWVTLEDAVTADPCPPERLASTCMAYVDVQKHAIRWP